jgi:hypothetical protein
MMTALIPLPSPERPGTSTTAMAAQSPPAVTTSKAKCVTPCAQCSGRRNRFAGFPNSHHKLLGMICNLTVSLVHDELSTYSRCR